MHKSCHHWANSMAEEFQTSTDINIIAKIAKYKGKYQMEWCKAHCHWTREQWERVLFGSLMGESGFDWYRGECYLPDCIVPNVTFGGGMIMIWGHFSEVGISSLFPVKGNLIASAYQNVLDNAMLPMLWQQLVEGPFLFPSMTFTVHKARSIKTWVWSGKTQLSRTEPCPQPHWTAPYWCLCI